MNALNNIVYVIAATTLVRGSHNELNSYQEFLYAEIQQLYSQCSQIKVTIIITSETEEHTQTLKDQFKLYFRHGNLDINFIVISDNEADNIIDLIEDLTPDLAIHIDDKNLEKYDQQSKTIHICYENGSMPYIPFPFSFKITPIFAHNDWLKFTQSKDSQLRKIYAKGQADYKFFFQSLRREFLNKLAENLPLEISRLIDEAYNNFEKVFLIPLNELQSGINAARTSQPLIEAIEIIAQSTPPNVGLILAEDGSYQCLDGNTIKYLQLKYPNLNYIKDIPFSHYFIASYVDGIIANASSVTCFFALLWKKPFFKFDHSHFSQEEYANFIDCGVNHFNDDDYNLFKGLFSNNIVVTKNSTGNYYDFLNSIYVAKDDTQAIFHLIYNYSFASLQQLKADILDNEESWMAFEQRFKRLSIPLYPDRFRVKLSQSKVISFDLFDTLVERDIANPADLFFLMECDIKSKFHLEFFNFKHFRCLAEENKRRECNWKYEVTLDEIYDEFFRLTAIFTKAQITEIKNLELAYEMMFVKPKKKMIREFYFSSLFVDYKSIMSDIYLNNDQLSNLLKNVGIHGYDHLLSSASYGHLKYTGKLFEIYLKKFKGLDYAKADFLHVGDNPISDGKSPESYGLQSYTFNKSIDNYRHSCINQLLPPSTHYDSINQSILTGFIANKFYSNHQNLISYDSVFSGSVYNVGYTAMGPLLFGFTQWLYRHARKNNINKLFFLSRDGWLLKRCFDLLYPDSGITTCYLYCSRRAFKFVLLKEWHDIVELFDLWFDHSTLADLLSVRYNVSWDEIDPKILKKYAYHEHSLISRLADRARTLSFLKELSPLILKKAAVARQDYLNYLISEGFTEDPTFNTIAIVDVGYGASMQLNFMDLFDCDNIHGYYFLTRNIHVTRTRFNNAILEGYLEGFDDAANVELSHPLNKYIQVFESLLSSPEGTLAGVKEIKSGKFAFDLVDVEKAEVRVARFKQIERGTLDFIKDVSTRLPRLHLQAFQLSPILSARYLIEFVRSPLKKDAKLLCEIDFEDDLTQSSSSLIDTGNYGNRNLNVDKSAWKEGAMAIFADELNKANDSTPSSKGTIRPTQLPHNISHSHRMLRKLKKNPYMFFNDSKLGPVRKFSVLFKPTSPQEKVFTPLINRLIK